MLSDVIKLQPENHLTNVEIIDKKIENYLNIIDDLKKY
jgi:hypothetical protein